MLSGSSCHCHSSCLAWPVPSHLGFPYTPRLETAHALRIWNRQEQVAGSAQLPEAQCAACIDLGWDGVATQVRTMPFDWLERTPAIACKTCKVLDLHDLLVPLQLLFHGRIMGSYGIDSQYNLTTKPWKSATTSIDSSLQCWRHWIPESDCRKLATKKRVGHQQVRRASHQAPCQKVGKSFS